MKQRNEQRSCRQRGVRFRVADFSIVAREESLRTQELNLRSVVTIVVISSLAFTNQCIANQDDFEHVLSNWAMVRQRMEQSFECQYEVREVMAGGPQQEVFSKQINKLAGDGFLEIIDHGSRSNGQVWGRNRDYTYQLLRNGPQLPWFLAEYTDPTLGTAGAKLIGHLTEIERWRYLFPWEPVAWTSFLQVVATAPASQVTMASETNAGVKTVKLVADLPERGLKIGLRLDPENSFLPVASEVETPDMRIATEYSDWRPVEGLGVPFQVVSRTAYTNRNADATSFTTVTSVSFERLPSSDFRLPAFGIPEPHPERYRSNRIALWVAIIGLIGAVGGLIWRRARGSKG